MRQRMTELMQVTSSYLMPLVVPRCWLPYPWLPDVICSQQQKTCQRRHLLCRSCTLKATGSSSLGAQWSMACALCSGNKPIHQAVACA